MAIRIVSRLVLLLAALALATTLMIGALSLLASASPVESTLLYRDHVAAVERAVETPADGQVATDNTPSPTVALVFAGIVLLAALPPVQRVHVYHRSYRGHD
jgi:hypothetical protein